MREEYQGKTLHAGDIISERRYPEETSCFA